MHVSMSPFLWLSGRWLRIGLLALISFGAANANAELWRCVVAGGNYKVYEAEDLTSAVAEASKDFGKVDMKCQRRNDLEVGTSGNVKARTSNVLGDPGTVTGRISSPLYLTPGFQTEGLGTEAAITAIYLGDFEHARIKSSSPEFSVMIGGYITAFDSRCRADLPANKVQVMGTECAREQYTVNGYGARVGPSTCIEYRQVPTGAYADPEVDGAQQNVARAVGNQIGAKILSNARAGVASVFDAHNAVGSDMDALLRMNGCTGPGIQRFQANLVRFAQDQPALRLPGGDTLKTARATSISTAGGTSSFKDSNYSRLLDDLIQENARSWLINQYKSNSVGEINVLGRDNVGQPQATYAKYSFSMSGRPATGGVTLVFEGGIPRCIRFEDQHNECRTVSPRVVSQYERGQYIDDGATAETPLKQRCANIQRMIEDARGVRGAQSSLSQLEANREKFCVHN